MIDIQLCEELSMNAHPALQTMIYDGWILRFAQGYTSRANSVNMIYPSLLPIEEKISHCEEIYATEGLPAIFKITPLSEKLDGALAKRGYEILTPTNIMFMPLDKCEMFGINADISDGITREWQENYLRLTDLISTSKASAARKVQNSIQNKVFCASISENGTVKACGICVIEREFFGLYDIYVDASCCGRGMGYAICSSLIEKARQSSAKYAYIQVVAANVPAVTLYKKLGYKDCYKYWYRIKK